MTGKKAFALLLIIATFFSTTFAQDQAIFGVSTHTCPAPQHATVFMCATVDRAHYKDVPETQLDCIKKHRHDLSIFSLPGKCREGHDHS